MSALIFRSRVEEMSTTTGFAPGPIIHSSRRPRHGSNPASSSSGKCPGVVPASRIHHDVAMGPMLTKNARQLLAEIEVVFDVTVAMAKPYQVRSSNDPRGLFGFLPAKLRQLVSEEFAVLRSGRSVGDDTNGDFGPLVCPHGERAAATELDIVGMRRDSECSK